MRIPQSRNTWLHSAYQKARCFFICFYSTVEADNTGPPRMLFNEFAVVELECLVGFARNLKIVRDDDDSRILFAA